MEKYTIGCTEGFYDWGDSKWTRGGGGLCGLYGTLVNEDG